MGFEIFVIFFAVILIPLLNRKSDRRGEVWD